MKKYIILAVIIIISVTSIAYLYTNYINNRNQAELNNKSYVNLYNKEITGSDLATLINKTLDKNTKNNIQKDDNEYYLDNGTNSIIIEVKFTESDKTYKIERIAQNGIENFINFYSNFKFKCTKIQYHTKTNFVSYMYFEQI